MMKSIITVRCAASNPGGSLGSVFARQEPRSCRCMAVRMFHTMWAGIMLDGTDTGGQDVLSSPLGPESVAGCRARSGEAGSCFPTAVTAFAALRGASPAPAPPVAPAAAALAATALAAVAPPPLPPPTAPLSAAGAPCNHCRTNGFNSVAPRGPAAAVLSALPLPPPPPELLLEKKGDASVASAPAREDGGTATSWSRTSMPSALRTPATRIKF
mmetsp:Transcript_64908/g.164384  ORF Transcript_64908/g.164384 Transcript_64908/m.164384 type:complete len:214 (-) Transcript_64908:1378-2019(-)